MAMVVKNNMAAVRTLNTLNSNSGALQKSLAKVSSGMRINSAQDDASGYAISERMRVQIRALDQANQNTQNGSSLMKTAEGAVSSTVEILKTLKEKAINAATDTNTDSDRKTIQKEVNQFIDQIDDNALVTFNGKYLVEGSKTQSGKATYTAFTNQNLATGTTGDTELTALQNRKGESLEIGTSDKITASFVKDGHTYATTFSVVDDNSDADGYKLADIFVKLNDEYVEQTSDTTNASKLAAFGAANTTTTATASFSSDDALQAISALDTIVNGMSAADLDEALTALANGSDITGSGAAAVETITGQTTATIDALKQTLAVAASYDTDGAVVSDFTKSALYTKYTAAKDDLTEAIAGAENFSDATQVKIASIGTDGTFSEGTAAAKADGDEDTVVSNMEAAMDLKIKGEVEVQKNAGGDSAATVAEAAAAITVGGGANGETAVSVDSSDFSKAYLLQKAGEGFKTNTEAFNKALQDAKGTEPAWKAEEGGGDDGEEVQSAAVTAALAFVNDSENAATIQAISMDDTGSIDAGTLKEAKQALAVLSLYDADGKGIGTDGVSAAEDKYNTAIDGLKSDVLTGLADSAKVTLAKLTEKTDHWKVEEADNATTVDDTNTLEKLAGDIVEVMEAAAGHMLDGDTVGTANSGDSSTAATIAAATTMITSKVSGGANGSGSLTFNVSSSGAEFDTAYTVKAAIANLGTAEEIKALADEYIEANPTTEMVSGLEGTPGDPSSAEPNPIADSSTLVHQGSTIGLAASGEMVKTADGSEGLTVTANQSGLGGQISGLTISVANSEGQVKKTTNEFLNAFSTTIFAANESKDYSLKLHVGANANQSISVGLQDMRAEALGLKGSDGTVIDISTQERANAAIAAFDNAIAKALDQQTTIGAVEARLEYTASNLTTSAENTQAAESAIRDADMAKEMTNYTKNNVLLQAAQSMLAQANQNASAVLSLLQ